MSEPPFSRRAATLLGAGALVSLLAAFALMLSPGDGIRPESYEADTYSRSAIGHYGLVQLLRDRGHEVRISRMVEVEDERLRRGLLVVAEPTLGPGGLEEDRARFARLVDEAERVLVVLPKRRAARDPERPGWVIEARVADPTTPESLLEQLAAATEWAWPDLVRGAAPDRWRSRIDLPDPSLTGDVQLLDHSGLEPLVACAKGVLVGRIDHITVLSDPDVIANHGLIANAGFTLDLFERLAEGGPITFDETLHGHALEPNFFHALGQFPLVLVPVHLLLLLGLSLWTAHGRFGPTLRDPLAIAPGKRFLIDNIAGLLRIGRSPQPSLRRFAQQRVRAAAARIGAPRGLADEQLEELLLARAARHLREDDLRSALSRAGSHRTTGSRDGVRVARELHEILEEITDGTH